MREIHKGDPDELEKFLNSPIHKQIAAKVKSPDEITAELSALSDEEWQIRRKEFNERLKRVKEEIKKDAENPALSPLELKQKFEQQLREYQEWDEEIERRLQLYLKMKRENSEILEDNLDEPPHPERYPVKPVPPFAEPNKPPDNNPWNEVVTEWDDALIEDYRDLFTDTDKAARDAFSQQLPTEDARKYYESRQAELHNEYASRIRAQLSGIPPEKRTEVMEGIRRELSRTWDADFINAVMRQLQQEK